MTAYDEWIAATSSLTTAGRERVGQMVSLLNGDDANEVRAAHKDNPIQADIIWSFVEEIQAFVQAVWYDPDAALKRGSFV